MTGLQRTVFERNVPARVVVDHALGEARHVVFWLDDLAERAGYPALSDPVRADIAVVGGGYTGLWSALRAKQRHPGARVVLVEGRSVGWAASGRNGGFCGARLTRGDSHDRGRPPDDPETLARLGQENLTAIGSAVSDLGLDCQWERTGVIDLAVEPYQIDWLQDAAARAARTGATHTFLDRAKLRAEVSSPTYEAGLLRPDDAALVHPARLATELARIASELGVEIFQRTRVTGLTRAGRGARDAVVLRTTSPAGEAAVLADRVLLGTSAFPSLLRRYRHHTVPAREHLIATEPLSAELLGAIGWRGRQGLADLANRSHYYRLTADHRIVFGGPDAGPETHRRLAEHLLTTFPQLEGIRLTHRWSGAVDLSTRSGAFFGQAAGGRVQHAAGLAGRGVAGSHFAAQVMLDRLDTLDGSPATERTALALVRRTPLPFPPEPIAALGLRATRQALDQADHQGGRRNTLLRSLDALGLSLEA
ncbi:Glycine/D-amino acid oxidase (deaminating) [Promicromonospora umidemergens]|uniref:FAD-dependent oxidoreductase n=1 Tax=Promicromonospora umidemergens TaxID=629679 RepID=A0ABP8Y597_9MICO|nr:FAD-dependent oxidoreductase [Promicromonospora umidemergens]MCP2282494.1 Glycine/D-amino acid oxidase (deaminating) [Promicromonospora umidemergens]